MSLFKKKGLTEQEINQQHEIKKKVTQELARAVKTLQQKHHSSQDPIHSNDEANGVCNVLEAIFLHGLKDSVAKKLVNYMNFGQSFDSSASLTFWQLAVQFTHSDVVTQLKRLGQITTEIGLCRAWVRVALNDGLMESYLNAMLSDNKTLIHYYQRTAYLCDIEQPEIMKTYLKGLMTLEFQLSYNSSVLNTWTSTPLVMAGIVSVYSTPPPVVATAMGSAVPNLEEQQEWRGRTSPSSSNHGNKSVTSSADTVAIQNPTIVSHDDKPDQVPDPSTAYYLTESVFTRTQMEEIKKFAFGVSPQGTSETSSGSSRSCPDPGHLNLSPSVYISQGIEREPVFEIAPVTENLDDTADSIVDSDKASVIDEASGEKTLTTVDTNPSVCDGAESETLQKQSENIDIVKADENSDAIVENEVSVYTRKPERRKAKKHKLKPKLSPSRRDSAPELSLAVADSIETVRKGLLRPRLSLDITAGMEPEHGSGPCLREHDIDEEEEDFSDSDSFPVGNSLGARKGWSSSFELEKSDVPDSARDVNAEGGLDIPEPDHKNESFGSLLQNYTPSSSLTTPSVDDLIQNLPRSGTVSTRPVMMKQGSVDSEYEVVTTPEYLNNIDSQNQFSRLALLGEIANEKGLDAQNYQCMGCTRPVGLIYGKPRVCTFDGGYYCHECHENDEYYIPALIIHNWDFRKHYVCKRNLFYLQEIEDQPVLNIEDFNMRLYEHVKDMQVLQELRIQLRFLKTYLFTCKQSVAEDFRKSVWPKEYYYDSIHLYSLADLLQVPNGQLLASHRKVIRFARKHVYECRLCSQKGFICEICNNPKVIYPFETDATFRCSQCKAVYHASCKPETKPCPKCQRRMLRQQGMLTPDSTDYASNPL